MRQVAILRTDEVETKDKALAVTKFNKRKGKQLRSNKQSDEKDIFCNYCIKKGHEIKDCRRLADKRKREAEEIKNPSSLESSSQPQQQQNRPSTSREQEHDSQDKGSQSGARVAFGLAATINTASANSVDSTSNTLVDTVWTADSGASFLMTFHLEWIADYREFVKRIPIRLGDGHIVEAYGKGFIHTDIGILDPVFYVPHLSDNLFSISYFAKKGGCVITKNDYIIFMDEDKELFRGNLNMNAVYDIKIKVKPAEHVALLSTTSKEWHERLAHVSPKIIQFMADNKIVEGIHIKNALTEKCEPCGLSKIKRASHPSSNTSINSKPGQILHFDTVGKIPESSMSGNIYFVLCKNACSAYRQVFFTKTKSEIPHLVKLTINQVPVQTGNEVLQIHTDQGSEFLNSDLAQFCKTKGIKHITSAAYTPEQNGMIERDIRTISEAAKTIRLATKLPRKYWAEAINTSVYILNRIINSNDRYHTPYELWTGTKPNFNNIHRFGELAIVRTPERERDKLDPKGRRMIFVGYTEKSNTFRFIEPHTDRLIIRL